MKPIRTLLFAGSALALAACSDQGPTAAAPSREAAPIRAARGGGVDGSYIVVVK